MLHMQARSHMHPYRSSQGHDRSPTCDLHDQGYLLRDTPNPYLAALAVAAGPNIVGHVVGPLATAGGFIWAGRQEGKTSPPSAGASQPP